MMEKVSGFIIVWKLRFHTIMKRYRVDRTAAEWKKSAACATRRRRRILLRRIHFYRIGNFVSIR